MKPASHWIVAAQWLKADGRNTAKSGSQKPPRSFPTSAIYGPATFGPYRSRIARFGGLQSLDLGPRSGEFMLLYYAETPNFMFRLNGSIWSNGIPSAEGHHRSWIDWVDWVGRKRRPRPSAPCATWGRAVETLRERKLVGGYSLPPTRHGNKSLKTDLSMCSRPIRRLPSTTSRKTWKKLCRWIDCFAADVGYGKTEVAMRAAFKAVMEENRQRSSLLLLCLPISTTIPSETVLLLSQSRLSYCRARSTKEQKEVVKKVEGGEIDVIIGTTGALERCALQRSGPGCRR